MSAPDLAELRRTMDACRVNGDYIAPPTEPSTRFYVPTPDSDFAALCPEHNALIVAAVNALPYLLAKVEAAERLAEACDRKAPHPDIVAAADAYRKAGAP